MALDPSNPDELYAAMEVGGIIHGDVPTWRTDPMPYGGVKESGNGREGSKYGMDDYLDFLALRLEQMWRLLQPTGVLYVHLDWHVVHHVKVMLDGKRATIHWENQDSFAEEFDEVTLTKSVFVIDGRVVGLECFGKPETFRKTFEKLLESYAMDAIDSVKPEEGGKASSKTQVSEFIDSAAA